MSNALHIIKTEQKALEINLNNMIYGTFAEIGAGQEVARNFFQVGAAAGTIAKTMSAYDKDFSDAIYGEEPSNRYVCESRLYKMLDHEFGLLEDRLEDKCELSTFFAFADTVAAINYSRTIKGNGWLGVRFQHRPCGPANDLMLHVKMHDNDNKLQQDAIGILGVNMIYACYYKRESPEEFVKSLIDGLDGRLSIDFIRIAGPGFDGVDNRLLNLYLVKHDITDIAIIDRHKNSVHASEFLYKKDVMVVRGNFRPPTLVTDNVLEASFEQFKKEEKVNPEKSIMMTELTMDYLRYDTGVIEDQDFLDRTELLCGLGHNVIISNCNNHQGLINYLGDYKVKNLGLVLGVRELLDIINDKYENNMDGRLLVAFGELFTKTIKVYAYPALELDSDVLITARTLDVPEGIKFLYKHLLDSNQIVEVEGYDRSLLRIWPYQVYQDIINQVPGWEDSVPKRLVPLIKEKDVFASKRQQQVASASTDV